MQIKVNEITLGNILKINDKKYTVKKKEHVKPGKGGAFVQLELKELFTNKKYNIKISTDKKVEKIIVYEVNAVYLYQEKDKMFFSIGEDGNIIESSIVDNQYLFTPGDTVLLFLDEDNNLLNISSYK